ncbi:hypothetical protein CVM52_10020 [Pseudooceanicola lipolyticus]|uniref:Uncharacterized protein n=1 Tax=Pseudooceanicola lipolyticus TaxID=2029104 RepID=A0A2M8J224_9RHOB|nr:hypothetical protein [Pseudooceanicola lipolyticus]PJE36833.1 hypothetical protein CVM52_10020 [Pseudooceanicola lipolyticus]
MKLTLTTALATALFATSAFAASGGVDSAQRGEENLQSEEIGTEAKLIEPGDGMESDVEDASRGNQNEQSAEVVEDEGESYTGGISSTVETQSRGEGNLQGEELVTGSDS